MNWLGIGIREKDIELIEKTIERLNSIISVKFVLDQEKNIEEIHIVSDGQRSAKQLSRDVQSILIATYDLNVDYKKISIAELPELALKKDKARLKIEKISYEKHGKKAKVQVVLKKDRQYFETSMEGPNTKRSVQIMLAEATLSAVEKAYGYGQVFVVEDVNSFQLAIDKVAIVIIMCLRDGEEKRFIGSSLIKDDSNDAIVRASLDAVNRYVSK